MHLRNLLKYSVAGSLSLLAFAATAQAADITVTNAEIAGGKLVVTGTTATANARVRLDGQFNATSDGSKAFSISAAYLPSDCVVSLQKVNPNGLGAATDAVVANCARGLSPRGGWSAAASYAGNDIVTYKGASWLARRGSSGSAPANGADWQLFAQAGSDGSDGDASTDAAQRVPPTGAAGGDLAGTYPNPTIRNLAVTAAKLNNGAVNTLKIADSAVTAAKINSGAVNTTKIADNGVTNSDIANDAITARNLGDGSVPAAALQNNSVTSLKIATAAVTARTIFDGAVRTQEVKDDTFADGGLQAIDLRADSVGTSEIQDRAIAAVDIGVSAITATEVAANTLTSSEIAPNAIGSSELISPHEHFSGVVTISDTTAHDGAYGFGTATVSCGFGEKLLSASVRWTDDNGHFERNYSGLSAVDRSVDPQTATLQANFDGGGGADTAAFQAVAECL